MFQESNKKLNKGKDLPTLVVNQCVLDVITYANSWRSDIRYHSIDNGY